MVKPRQLGTLLVALLIGCEDGGPTPTDTDHEKGPIVLMGAVLDGNSNPLRHVKVNVTILPAGCTGTLRISQEVWTDTASAGAFRTSLDRAATGSMFCVRAEADPQPGVSYDNNVVLRDSVAATADSIRLDLPYDWSVVTVHQRLYYQPQVTADALSARVTWSGNEQMLQPRAELSYTRMAGGTAVTVTAYVQSTLGTATVSKTLSTGRDRVHGIDVIVSPIDPVLQCFGCMGKVSAPIKNASGAAIADSLFIIWGENSITQPWVY